MDFLVIGAGVVGLSVALELRRRYPKSSIAVIEKEKRPGLHSSGRNSGVLHSGIYYPPDTIKAKVCRQGAIEMAAFCKNRKLPINRIGKILLPVSHKDRDQLNLLEARAKANQVTVERLDKSELRKLEPNTFSVTGEALFVPGTSVADPFAVMTALVEECKQSRIKMIYSVPKFKAYADQKTLSLADGTKLQYGYLINSAGLHADTVAHQFGVGERYTLLPFKGIYWKLSPTSNLRINHLIYPVPDLRVPFLGVHTTTNVTGDIYFGPTAVPAFGRENYHALQDVNIRELGRITKLLLQQVITGQDGFRRLAWQEGLRYFKPCFAKAARQIVPQLKDKDLISCDKVGIRAQMFDSKEKKLVTDFLVENGSSSTHILNAISPAWTCAFPFARFVIDNFVEK